MTQAAEQKTKPRRRWLWLTAALLLALSVTGLAGAWVGWQRYVGPGLLAADKVLVIPRGTGVQGIAQHLVRAGIARHQWDVLAAARLRRDGHRLRAGEYAFPARISLKDALDLLISGKTIIRRLTIPEGLTSWQIGQLLRAESALDGDLPAILPPDGSLLPETYHFSLGDDRAGMLGRMQADMDSVLARLWAERAPDLPLANPAQALILASIVERETGVAQERARVAGVFINRLRLGMRLQSDPTIIYALSDGRGQIDRDLTRADWKLQSPYNTYVVTGLPPGPIANPGLSSLQAVLRPDAHKYLYFVADGTGGHAFAETLEQHNRNVAAWRKVRDGG